jgi:hypothetical protein
MRNEKKDSYLPGFYGTDPSLNLTVKPASWATDWLTGGTITPHPGCGQAYTNTKCILFTMWCQDAQKCYDGKSLFPVERAIDSWHICGVCGNPFDW